LLKGLLEERGIAARVVNDAMQIAGGELPLGWTSAPKVVVGDIDAAAARQIAMEFDEQTAHAPSLDEPEVETDDTNWADWPCCPTCGERRSARCPICGESGSQFPLADIEESANGRRVFLLCSSCDDLFLPDWYRLCARCGHDYGDGFEVTKPVPQPSITAQTWLTLGVLLAGVAAFGAYFFWLFRR
jgi:hypothetical protein